MHSFAHWVVFCLRILHHQTKCSNMPNISAQEVSCVREYVAELNNNNIFFHAAGIRMPVGHQLYS